MSKAPLPQLLIRRATPADNTLLAEIGAETFHETYVTQNTPEDMAAYLAASFSPEKQARELAYPAHRFLIAEIDKAAVGYACLKLVAAPSAVVARKPMEVARLYARKTSIGKGIGAQLMNACIAEARQAGCDVIWLGVWERNTAAIAFYRKAGFVEIGEQVFQLGEDRQRDFLMARGVD